MKIAHICFGLDTHTGWGRLTNEVVMRLKQRGCELEIFTEKGERSSEKNIVGRGWHAITSALKIRPYLKGVDIVHAWEGNPYGITAYLASVGLRKKNIITATGAYSVQPLYRASTRFLLMRAYKNASKILCISTYIKDEIDRVVPGAETEVVTLGVDFEKFRGERFVPKERFILGVGNVGRRKGYHVSIPAFGRIAQKFPELKYYIAGTLDKNFYARSQ